MHPEETRIYIALVIANCTITAMIFFYIIKVVKHRQQNMAARNQSILQEMGLLEAERERIAMDLHDDIGGILFGLKFKIGAIPVATPSAENSIREVCGSIDRLIEKVKIVSNQLLPAVLQQQGLKAALIEMLMPFEESGDYQVSYTFNFPSGIIAGNAAIHIYRIIQEITNNIKKHAEAGKIDILIYTRKHIFYILVEDNGKGFELEEARWNKGMGLRNIRMRTDILNGRMYTTAAPGKGTTYRFEIPLTVLKD